MTQFDGAPNQGLERLSEISNSPLPSAQLQQFRLTNPTITDTSKTSAIDKFLWSGFSIIGDEPVDIGTGKFTGISRDNGAGAKQSGSAAGVDTAPGNPFRIFEDQPVDISTGKYFDRSGGTASPKEIGGSGIETTPTNPFRGLEDQPVDISTGKYFYSAAGANSSTDTGSSSSHYDASGNPFGSAADRPVDISMNLEPQTGQPSPARFDDQAIAVAGKYFSRDEVDNMMKVDGPRFFNDLMNQIETRPADQTQDLIKALKTIADDNIGQERQEDDQAVSKDEAVFEKAKAAGLTPADAVAPKELQQVLRYTGQTYLDYMQTEGGQEYQKMISSFEK